MAVFPKSWRLWKLKERTQKDLRTSGFLQARQAAKRQVAQQLAFKRFFKEETCSFAQLLAKKKVAQSVEIGNGPCRVFSNTSRLQQLLVEALPLPGSSQTIRLVVQWLASVCNTGRMNREAQHTEHSFRQKDTSFWVSASEMFQWTQRPNQAKKTLSNPLRIHRCTKIVGRSHMYRFNEP